MKNFRNIFLALLGCVILSFAASAQGTKGGTTFGGVIQMDKVVHDFGDIMMSDGPVKATFSAKNIGKKPIVIYNVVSSCGCTDVEWTRQPLKPGESGTITATYSNDEPYPFDKTLTVYFSTLKKPIVLRLRGESHDKKLSLKEMYPVHFGNLAFKSADIKGGNLSQGEQKSGVVKVANIGSSPLNVSFRDVSSNLSLNLSKNPIPAGSTAEIAFTITADRSLWGKNYYYATPVVGGKVYKAVGSGGEPKLAGTESVVADPNPELGAGHEKIGIFAITKENFSSWTDKQRQNGSQPMFTESTYSFGKVKAGETVNGAFGLTNKGKSTLRIYKVDSESTSVEVQPIKDLGAGMSTSVPFTLETGSLPKGEALLVLNLYTNSPLRPIVNLFITGWVD